MEEKTVEIFDYLTVIRKRKILIIIVVIVCIVVGIGIEIGIGEKNSRYKPEVTYQARALVKIGKKAVLSTPPTDIVPTTGITSSLVYLDSPGELAVTIPVRYGDKVNNQLGYQLEVRQFGELVSMVEIIMKGPDRGVERVLKEVVNMLIEEHRKKAEVSTVAYKELITKLKKESNSLQEVIAVNRAEIEEVKSAERMFKESILEPMIEIRGAEGLEGKYNLLNILYLRVLDREESLNRNQEVLESNRQRLMLYKMYIESLEGNNTTLIGEIRSTAVKPKKINTTVIAGIAGLIMALFIAFFMEYIEESKLRRKGKRQVNLA